MPKSFKSALKSYKESFGLSPDDAAHIQRWAEDDRTEEVWRKIETAVQQKNITLPAEAFVREILGARQVAMAIGHRGEWRDRYRKEADQMQRTAKFLRRSHPLGMPPYPGGTELAGLLDDAARYFRKQVEVSRIVPSVLKFGRKSKPQAIFMNMVGNDLNNITGSWLDEEVGILTEIAFASPDIIDPEDARRARRQAGPRRTARKVRR